MNVRLYIHVFFLFALANRALFSDVINPGLNTIQFNTIQIKEQNPQGCRIDVDLRNFTIIESEKNGISFTDVSISGTEKTSEVGKASVPFIAGLLSIPADMNISIVEVVKGKDTILNSVTLYPAQDDNENKRKVTEFAYNDSFYTSTTPYPSEVIRIETSKIRVGSNDYVHVKVFPLLFTPSEKKVQIYFNLSIKLKFSSEKIGQSTVIQSPLIDRSIIPSVAGKPAVLQKMCSIESQNEDNLLIIAPTAEYKTALEEYAKWKTMSGVYTKVVTKTETGNTIEQIKAYVKNVSKDAVHPVNNLLLIGEKNQIPCKEINMDDWDFYSDSYYGQLEGSDYIPEVMTARIPVSNVSELNVVINKMMKYEKTPNMSKSDYYGKALMCSNNEYASQIQTKRDVAAILTAKKFIVDTLMMKMSGTSPSGSAVFTSFTNGKGILNYRGEGWTSGWEAYDGKMDSKNVSSLNNTDMPTFVTSIGCGVGNWADEKETGLGECLLRSGTETQAKGAVTFIGPMSNTNTAYNNWIDRGIYNGLFNEGIETPGRALLRGKMEMLTQFGVDDDKTKMHFEEYTVLGDPTLRIYKSIPVVAALEKPSVLSIGTAQAVFTVTGGGKALPDVRVTLTSSSGLFLTKKTDASGKAVFNTNISNEELVYIVVKGNSVVPVIDSMMAKTQSTYLASSEIEITDTDGNNDKLLNPNENASLEFSIINSGTTVAKNTTVSMTSTSSQINLSDNVKISIAEIAPNGTSNKLSVKCKVSDACTIGTVIPLTIAIVANGQTFNIEKKIMIAGCNIVFSNLLIKEVNTVHSSGRLDPGETANLIFKLNNMGNDMAKNLKAKLKTSDSRLSIIDGDAVFGTININGTGNCDANCFQVKVSNDCPVNTVIEAELEVSNTDALYTYARLIKVNIPVSVPVPQDYTGPDEAGYIILTSKDSLYKRSVSYTWNDISTKGTSVKINYNISLLQSKAIATLPFTFTFYEKQYSSVNILEDGIVSFDVAASITKFDSDSKIPKADGFKTFISAIGAGTTLEDSIKAGSSKSRIFYYNDLQNKQFIIQYQSLNADTNVTFQIVLCEKKAESGNNEILLNYKRSFSMESPLIGIENESETIALAYCNNGTFQRSANGLSGGMTLLITTDKPECVVPVISENSDAKPTGFAINNLIPVNNGKHALIKYCLPGAGIFSLSIYNINGKVVKDMHVSHNSAGIYQFLWDGSDRNGCATATGLYVIKMTFNKRYFSKQFCKTDK